MDDAKLSLRAIRQDPAQLTLQGLVIAGLQRVEAGAVL